jgi:uncharacterized membrane protein
VWAISEGAAPAVTALRGGVKRLDACTLSDWIMWTHVPTLRAVKRKVLMLSFSIAARVLSCAASQRAP